MAKVVPASPPIPKNAQVINRNVADRFAILDFNYPVPIEAGGRVLLSFQHFHLQKCLDPVWRATFMERTFHGDAAMMAQWLATELGMRYLSATLKRGEDKTITIGKHWTPEYAKRAMWGMLLLKFRNTIARRVLLETGNKPLVDAIPNSAYWSCDVPVDTHARMMMQIRKILQTSGGNT